MKEDEGIIVTDVIVQLDGYNPSFRSYMMCDEANRIVEAGGLSQVESVHLRETPDRQIPETFKKGEVTITDILVQMNPNIAIYVN